MEIFIKELKNIFALYRELFILLGVIILVWFLVALIIKKFIRKPERWDDLENDIEDKEWLKKLLSIMIKKTYFNSFCVP